MGDDSSFILLQAVVERSAIPVWVRGGIGPRVAAGCVAAGAAGVVLDGAAWLTCESSLPAADRSRIERWDGGETRVFGPPDGPGSVASPRPVRPFSAGCEAAEKLAAGTGKP